jgi:hypothetical protein
VVVVAGVADHYGWGAVVVVGEDGSVVDRRKAPLLDDGLPASPIHHECQSMPLAEAEELVARVEASVAIHVRALWDELVDAFGVTAVAVRDIPDLPASLEERITSYHAQTRADPAMYRRLLVEDATRRGWSVRHYDHKRVEDEAVAALGVDLTAPREGLGPPWAADHRKAYAAALLAQQAAG